MQLPKLYEKSNNILKGNIEWIISSDIRIKEGDNKGALYAWKNLTPPYFPFIYSEITGYAITCFSWIASEFANPVALEAAEDAYLWTLKHMNNNLVYARPPAKGIEPNQLSNMLYSFDNGMILTGILSLYKITRRVALLQVAEKMAKALIEYFFDGEKLVARLDHTYKSITPIVEGEIVKWSTIPGAYHCKLSLALLELSRLTENVKYAQVSDSLCDYAIRLQGSRGYFFTNPGADIVYLHPHLYACEGLINSGLRQSNDRHYTAGLKGIKWAMKYQSSTHGGLLRHTGKESVEQSDCTAQLLRLLIICYSELQRTMKKSKLDKVIDRLHLRLLDFYIPDGKGLGAIRYQFDLNSACSWCTMFSMQALTLVKKRNSQNINCIDYLV